MLLNICITKLKWSKLLHIWTVGLTHRYRYFARRLGRLKWGSVCLECRFVSFLCMRVKHRGARVHSSESKLSSSQIQNEQHQIHTHKRTSDFQVAATLLTFGADVAVDAKDNEDLLRSQLFTSRYLARQAEQCCHLSVGTIPCQISVYSNYYILLIKFFSKNSWI